MPQITKDNIRKRIKRHRQSLSLEHQKRLSQEVCKAILTLDEFKTAKKIGLYQAFQGEVDLNLLWDMALKAHKLCYFPILKANKTLGFFPANKKTPFVYNKYHILEPTGLTKDEEEPLHHIDLMILPLVAFDSFGHRVGMGAGYYDKTLAQNGPQFMAGAAYEFQKIDSIRPDAWDIPLSFVITEKNIYRSKK